LSGVVINNFCLSNVVNMLHDMMIRLLKAPYVMMDLVVAVVDSCSWLLVFPISIQMLFFWAQHKVAHHGIHLVGEVKGFIRNEIYCWHVLN